MTMRITRLAEAEPFSPVGHHGVGPVRLQGGADTPMSTFTVILSHYLPGGTAELAPQPTETVYVVLAGELVMSSDGEEATLGSMDSVHFTQGSLRTVENRTHLPASMLVVRAVASGEGLTVDAYQPSSDEVLAHPPAHRPVDGDFETTRVTFAAMALYDHLDGEQRARVVVAMDHDNRRNWNFLPESGRRGVAIRDMSQTQRYLTHRLVAECLSVEGYAQVVQVMSLEHVLRELNAPVFGHVAAHFRDPEGYFLTFFDQPQPDSDWGWRLVGHHLSLNFTVAGQDLLAATPLLLGSEPARLGPLRILGQEEDLGFALLDTLDDDQTSTATIHPTPPPDFATRCVPVLGDEEWPDVHGVGRRDAPITDADRKALRWLRNERQGLSRGSMGRDQQEAFDRLLESFVLRLKTAQVGREMDRIRAAGLDDLHFVWAGSHRIDQPHYFRIEGPVTLVEFDNTEDGANHVHCVWRDPTNDFGHDILARHRTAQYAPTQRAPG